MWKLADDDEGKGRKPTPADEAKIKAFLRKTPNLTDDKFHDFCEELGVNVHKAEEIAYRMARTMHGGKAEEEGKSPRSMSQKQMAMGQKVEMEHTRDPKAAREIAADHLAEIPDYYSRLHKMESEAKMKKSAAFEAGVVYGIEKTSGAIARFGARAGEVAERAVRNAARGSKKMVRESTSRLRAAAPGMREAGMGLMQAGGEATAPARHAIGDVIQSSPGLSRASSGMTDVGRALMGKRTERGARRAAVGPKFMKGYKAGG